MRITTEDPAAQNRAVNRVTTSGDEAGNAFRRPAKGSPKMAGDDLPAGLQGAVLHLLDRKGRVHLQEGGDGVKITLPLPDKRLSPNHTVGTMKGRMGKYSATKKARELARMCCISHIYHGHGGNGIPTFTGYTLAFFWPDARKRDDDNAQAACKAYRDGIADALGVDDSSLKLAALPTFQIDRKNPRLEITLI